MFAPANADASIETLVLQEDLDLRASLTPTSKRRKRASFTRWRQRGWRRRRRTKADLVALGAIILESRRQLEQGRNLADADEAFHLALIAAAKNDILLRMAKSLYLMTRSVRQAYFEATGFAATSIEEHEALLESVERRDAELAATLMRKHYAGSSARWRKAFARN